MNEKVTGSDQFTIQESAMATELSAAKRVALATIERIAEQLGAIGLAVVTCNDDGQLDTVAAELNALRWPLMRAVATARREPMPPYPSPGNDF